MMMWWEDEMRVILQRVEYEKWTEEMFFFCSSHFSRCSSSGEKDSGYYLSHSFVRFVRSCFLWRLETQNFNLSNEFVWWTGKILLPQIFRRKKSYMENLLIRFYFLFYFIQRLFAMKCVWCLLTAFMKCYHATRLSYTKWIKCRLSSFGSFLEGVTDTYLGAQSLTRVMVVMWGSYEVSFQITSRQLFRGMHFLFQGFFLWWVWWTLDVDLLSGGNVLLSQERKVLVDCDYMVFFTSFLETSRKPSFTTAALTFMFLFFLFFWWSIFRHSCIHLFSLLSVDIKKISGSVRERRRSFY